VHSNGAVDALDALVNAALMAGENVTERVVRKVFSEALDIVVHVDRDDGRAGAVVGDAAVAGARRQITEIVAVEPALGDGFTCEPLFVREGLGRPLVWTGAVPARLESRIDRACAQPGALRALLGGGGEK
jgi:hypothetical protein